MAIHLWKRSVGIQISQSQTVLRRMVKMCQMNRTPDINTDNTWR